LHKLLLSIMKCEISYWNEIPKLLKNHQFLDLNPKSSQANNATLLHHL